MKEIGFIILRHVISDLSNKYWINCYNCIRKKYPENKILIIDDSSNYDLITNIELYKTTIINSEYSKRGELLPYYYYLHNKLFDIAVIIHDSVFINKYIDFNIENYKMIWDFDHTWDDGINDIKIIETFKNTELLDFYNNKKLWKGCFGSMCIITHDYLTNINTKYDISNLLNHIITRYDRCSFERVIACLLQINDNNNNKSLFGDIHSYSKWGIAYDNKDEYNDLPLIKVWTAR